MTLKGGAEMDEIPPGLKSITPILQETLPISEKSGAAAQQAEIMPLPDNSFNSDNATAELLDNPFTLNINIKSHESSRGAAGGAGRMPAGIPPEENDAGTLPGDAYTLSLGGGEAAASSEMARELTRMKNYEMLGKAARQARRLNPDSRPAGPGPQAAPDEEDALLRRRISSLLARAGGLESGEAPESADGQAGIAEADREQPSSPPDVSAKNTVPAEDRRQPLISVPLAFQLTSSDYETILSMEPDLQEALFNMLGSPVGDAAPRPASSAPETVRVLSEGMTRLKKIRELPYSLYLFGEIPEKRPETEEEEESGRAAVSRRDQPAALEFLRISEAVKMAAVLHHIYHGGMGFFPKDDPWYVPYVQYAVRHDIILSGEFDDLNAYATRAEAAYIFSNAVPRAEFPTLNPPPMLSDIGENDRYGDAVLLLHKAGVLVTSDRDGRFYPEKLITRAEAAAIIGRIATPGDRISRGYA